MMNVFRLCSLRSAYSTKATDKPLPGLARVARTASTPLAVRLRRSKKFGSVKEGTSDSTKTGLSPSEKARYIRLKAIGEIQKDPVTNRELSETEWLASVNARRSRVRGFARKVRKSTGNVDTEVVGRSIN